MKLLTIVVAMFCEDLGYYIPEFSEVTTVTGYELFDAYDKHDDDEKLVKEN